MYPPLFRRTVAVPPEYWNDPPEVTSGVQNPVGSEAIRSPAS